MVGNPIKYLNILKENHVFSKHDLLPEILNEKYITKIECKDQKIKNENVKRIKGLEPPTMC